MLLLSFCTTSECGTILKVSNNMESASVNFLIRMFEYDWPLVKKEQNRINVNMVSFFNN